MSNNEIDSQEASPYLIDSLFLAHKLSELSIITHPERKQKKELQAWAEASDLKVSTFSSEPHRSFPRWGTAAAGNISDTSCSSSWENSGSSSQKWVAEPRQDWGAVEEASGIPVTNDWNAVEPRQDWGAVEPHQDWNAVEPRQDWGAVEPRQDWGAVEPRQDWGAVEENSAFPKASNTNGWVLQEESPSSHRRQPRQQQEDRQPRQPRQERQPRQPRQQEDRQPRQPRQERQPRQPRQQEDRPRQPRQQEDRPRQPRQQERQPRQPQQGPLTKPSLSGFGGRGRGFFMKTNEIQGLGQYRGRRPQPRTSDIPKRDIIPRPDFSEMSYVTSLVTMPPKSTWDPFIAIKKIHLNPRIKRPPYPHLTLLAPFCVPSQFEATRAWLTDKLADVESFTLEFKTFKLLRSGRDDKYTLYLDPIVEPPGAITKLYETLSELVPESQEHKEAGSKHAHGFTPHLGVGLIQSKEEADELLEKYQKDWIPIRYTVKEIYIMSRVSQTSPFEVRVVIPLSNSPSSPYFSELPLYDNN